MKTKKSRNLNAPVLISKTQHLVRITNKIPPGEYYGIESHFLIDYNTQEAILQAVWNYAVKNDEAQLMTQINMLKQNLYITNPDIKIETR
ncbi:MAG: hypothetical protein P4L28_12000 [Paludibacteraceae bacterium]|nr:hypothetical protein [Paludibacteraceae bacterium]